jgi:hypothetical protein
MRNAMSRLIHFLFVGLIASVVIGLQAQDVPADSSSGTVDDEYNRFGIVEGFWFPELTCELGAGWERIIFDWAQHQPESADDWNTLNVDDRWLKAADACNREVVAILKNTPAWATDGIPGAGLPRGLELPLDDPGNLWARFVRRTVDYYASRGVTHFIIWNEPDISADTYGYEFEGDMDDYIRLLEVAYRVAKETNPAATIHLAGTTYWHDVNAGREPYMSRLVARLVDDDEAAAHDYYFDVLSLHIYFRTDTVYTIVREMREMLDGHGLTDKAIWINETNAAPTDDPDWPVERPQFQIDLQHQAAFLVQSAALSLAAGVERVAAYKLYDQQLPPGGESFGLLNPASAVPRPGFYAWQLVTQHFNDVTSADLQQTETLDIVRLIHRNGQQTFVMWARTADRIQVNVDATGEKAYLIQQTGGKRVLRPSDGVYTLTLSAAHCEEGEGCFLGGDVSLLVQPAGAVTVQENAPDAIVNTIIFEQE